MLSTGSSDREVRMNHCRVAVPGTTASGAQPRDCVTRYQEELEIAFAAQVAVGTTEFFQRLRLDLACALARNAQLVADDIQRARPAVLDAEPQLDARPLARRQHVERVPDTLAQQLPAGFLFGRRRHDIFEHAAQR